MGDNQETLKGAGIIERAGGWGVQCFGILETGGEENGDDFSFDRPGRWDVSRGGTEHLAESLASEGFIHCSEDAEQLLRVAERLYGGREDLLALEVEVDRLGSPLKREPSRSGEIYPAHIRAVEPGRGGEGLAAAAG